MTGILYTLGDMLVSSKLEPKLQKYVFHAGKTKMPYEMIGAFFLASIIGGFAAFIFAYIPFLGLGIFSVALLVPTMIFLFFGLLTIIWMFYEINVFKRKEKIEKVLPDFLDAVAVNLRAGMTFDKALWNSVEPEYDVLSKEIEIVAKKVMTGEDTEDALKEFASKYDSPILKESIDLIIVGLRSGGEVSDLIERVVDNVKQATFLKKELVANIMSYVIFISMISLFIAPTLFALSYNLMLIIQDLGAKLASSASNGVIGGLSGFGKVVIEKKDFINYSRWSISIIAVTTSLIIADLREGSIKGGIKYVFAFIGIALIVYQALLFVFTSIFGSMVV